MFNSITPSFNKLKHYADWKLLIFLILFMDVKLAVKLVAIVLIYLFQFDFKFGFKLKNSRLPLFYLIVIGIAVVDALLYQGFFTIRYNLVLLTGIGFWILCILAMHQVMLAVERNDAGTLHRTIFVFFLINALISLLTLFLIICEIRTINPYTYQGLYQKYFIGTGDYIRGITFDVSITNSVLNSLGVIYFMWRKKAAMTLLCMAVLLFSGSNSLNILTMCILFGLFIFKSTRDQKSLIVVCLMFMVIFMAKISPHNSNYAVNATHKIFHQHGPAVIVVSTHTTPLVETADSLLNPDERRQKIARLYLDSEKLATTIRVKRTLTASIANVPIVNPLPVIVKKLAIPLPNLDTQPYWEAPDTSAMRHILLAYIAAHRAELPISGKNTAIFGGLPGKVTAMLQLFSFFRHHPERLIAGDGLGNFSSKVAFKATNLGFNGSYLAKYVYINPDFMANHLDVYLNFFSREPGLHSVINNPNAVYFQLLSEYGIIGLAAFLLFYLWYFLRHYRRLSYGIPVLALLLSVFFLEYWFEQLSIVVFVELMLLTDLKDNQHQLKPAV